MSAVVSLSNNTCKLKGDHCLSRNVDTVDKSVAPLISLDERPSCVVDCVLIDLFMCVDFLWRAARCSAVAFFLFNGCQQLLTRLSINGLLRVDAEFIQNLVQRFAQFLFDIESFGDGLDAVKDGCMALAERLGDFLQAFG